MAETFVVSCGYPPAPREASGRDGFLVAFHPAVDRISFRRWPSHARAIGNCCTSGTKGRGSHMFAGHRESSERTRQGANRLAAVVTHTLWE